MPSVPPPLALIVEDTPLVAALLARMLQSQGYRVQLAASLSAARAALQSELPQLLTLDMQLPDGNGLALLEQLRAEPATAAIPVVVISGSFAQVPKVIALAQGVLAKPFALDELVSVVQRAGAPLPSSVAVGEPGGAYG